MGGEGIRTIEQLFVPEGKEQMTFYFARRFYTFCLISVIFSQIKYCIIRTKTLKKNQFGGGVELKFHGSLTP